LPLIGRHQNTSHLNKWMLLTVYFTLPKNAKTYKVRTRRSWWWWIKWLFHFHLYILCLYALVGDIGSGRGDVGIIWNLGMVSIYRNRYGIFLIVPASPLSLPSFFLTTHCQGICILLFEGFCFNIFRYCILSNFYFYSCFPCDLKFSFWDSHSK
jgi:hypothetical protein